MKEKKLDLAKEYTNYYTAKLTPEVVEFGEIPHLTIEGKGEPGGKEFTSKIEALFILLPMVSKTFAKRRAKILLSLN